MFARIFASAAHDNGQHTAHWNCTATATHCDVRKNTTDALLDAGKMKASSRDSSSLSNYRTPRAQELGSLMFEYFTEIGLVIRFRVLVLTIFMLRHVRNCRRYYCYYIRFRKFRFHLHARRGGQLAVNNYLVMPVKNRPMPEVHSLMDPCTRWIRWKP